MNIAMKIITLMLRRTRSLFAAAFFATSLSAAEPLVPVIDGDWWTVAGNPDLGALTGAKQQPVDFAVWQAADGTWQLWSCIRHTKGGGNSRLFHGWEGKNLTDTHWTPKGIVMRADPGLGEQDGGLQAPHVIRVEGTYYMFYGDTRRICLATSQDGKTFERYKNERGQPDLFTGPYSNTRDPMVVKVGGLYHCYYSGHRGKTAPTPIAAIFCRTSADLLHWSEPVTVAGGGAAATRSDWPGGDAECPFVVQRDGRFYLFRNQLYVGRQLNTQYASPDPLNFGVNDDRYEIGTLPVAAPEIIRHNDQYYMAALLPDLKGIRIARLKFTPRS